MQKPPIKNNPAFLTDEELASAFAVRHDDLNLIVRVLRENTSDSNQHVLVIGPRGIGKTMLVRRVALEVRQDEELRHKWYPLIFAEESYEVGSAGEFWLESLFHLGRQTGDPRWGRTYGDLKREPVEDRLRERALAQLMDFVDSQGKRILLIVENLNMMLGDQITEDDAWKLRHTLMHEPRLMLLATATARLDVPENTNKAMFELFKSHVLKPLNDGECQAVWRSVVGQELGPRRIRAVSILTGGNPRLLAIISHFGAHLSFAELMQDMTGLVDDHTDYFKSHLDALPPTERKVYAALADLWDPSSAREVALASRLGVSMASSLLKRLVGRGAVVEAQAKGRTKRYQVAEHMYNIYYLMRRRGAPSERVRAVVQFMLQFYEETELVELARRLTEEACHLSREDRQYHYHAFEGTVRTAPPGLRSRILQCAPRGFLEAPDRPDSLRKWLTEAGVGEICPCAPRRYLDERVRDLMRKGRNAARDAREEEAEKIFREVIGIDAACPDAWRMLGRILDKQPERRGEAEEAFRKATEGAPSDPCAWDDLGHFLSEGGSRRLEAENAFRKALELYADCSDAWLGLAKLAGEQPGGAPAAAEAYHEAEEACVRQTEKYSDQAERWYRLGRIRHSYTRRFPEAEAAYRKAIEVNPKHASAWAYLGFLLHGRLQRYTEAETAYRTAIEINPKLAWAWERLGSLLHEPLQRYTEAEAAYRRAAELDPEHACPWVRIGILLERCWNRYDAAEAAYRKAIEINPEHTWAWAQLGDLLARRCGKPEQAEEAYSSAINADGQAVLPRTHLVELMLTGLNQPERALDMARQSLADMPGNVVLLNGLAWDFFEFAPPQYLFHAEEWARKAVEMGAEAESVHTLACLLARVRKGTEALTFTRTLLENTKFVSANIDDMVTLFAELVAADCAAEALKTLRDSTSSTALEPVAVALQMHLGTEVHVAPEIAQVAKDVLRRFQAVPQLRQDEREIPR